MKWVFKFLLSFTLAWIFSPCAYGQVSALRGSLLESHGMMAFRPSDMMIQPQLLMKAWMDEPIPVSLYSTQEKDAQRLLNQKVSNGIITSSPVSSEKEWIDVDFEEITPYTWKWIDCEMPKKDGTLTKLSLCRPHWWLRSVGADSVGRQFWLSMPELGSEGWTTVKAIRVNQLDTRFWDEKRKGDYVSRPITGKFEHESSDVYYLHFGDNPDGLGVTGSHPIWSVDRNDWIEAGSLVIGEKVKTQDGITVLRSRTKSAERQKVYNLEVYKDHNFLVSTDKVLVHNSCLPKMQRIKMYIENLRNAKPASNFDEALNLVNKTLDDIEDAYSGVAKNPNAINMPNIDDGRMYGILDNKYIKQLEDGTIRAFTRKNTIIFDQKGGFKIYFRDKSQPNQIGNLILEKAGAGR